VDAVPEIEIVPRRCPVDVESIGIGEDSLVALPVPETEVRIPILDRDRRFGD
jgi:hypothetical protein